MTISLLPKLRSRWQYTFESAGFRPKTSQAPLSADILNSAKQLRGADRPPSIFLHGMMPRSGSVYTGNLLKLHGDIHPYPHELWEVPFLQQTGKIKAVQAGFEEAYRPSAGKLKESDFLCLFGASFIGHMHQQVPTEKTMLLKMAGIQYLDHFFDAFPHEQLLLVLRDGRDVVRSTLKSWPSLGFINVCRRWHKSAQLAMAVEHKFRQRQQFMLVKFEQVLAEPDAFVERVSAEFNLPLEQYNFDQIEKLPIRGSSSIKVNGGVTWQAVDKPKAFNPVGGWQQWPTWKKTIFKQIAGQSLIDLGYAADNSW